MEKSIRDLIARLPIPGLKESTNRHCIAEILSNTLSIPIKANQITLKDLRLKYLQLLNQLFK
jgi:hypothetical protein